MDESLKNRPGITSRFRAACWRGSPGTRRVAAVCGTEGLLSGVPEMETFGRPGGKVGRPCHTADPTPCTTSGNS